MKTDSEIQKDVNAELKWEPAIKVSEIGVAVKDGIVILSGTVDSYYKKSLVEKVAKRVAGVKAVVEEIDVKIPGAISRTDVDIAAAIINALRWSELGNANKIKVQFDKGVLTMDGEVDWNFEKDLAFTLVHNITGVCEIVNNLKVKHRAVINDIKQNITSAFVRSATLDSGKINIEIVGDKVILTGSVRSWAEKKDAEKTVWCSPGVMSIDNKIKIDSEVVMY